MLLWPPSSAKDPSSHLHYVRCPFPHSVYLRKGGGGQDGADMKTPFKESGDAAVGRRVFLFGGQRVWNGIDFTAKAGLIDRLQGGKYTIASDFLLTHQHKQIPRKSRESGADGCSGGSCKCRTLPEHALTDQYRVVLSVTSEQCPMWCWVDAGNETSTFQNLTVSGTTPDAGLNSSRSY